LQNRQKKERRRGKNRSLMTKKSSPTGTITIPNVALTDENAGVVDRASQILLQNLCLQTSLQQILDLQAENVIELVLGLIQNTSAVEAAQESSTLEQALGILLIESEKLTSGVADLGQGELNAVNLALVLQTELADKLKLGIETFLVALGARSLVDLPV
jgi:hypothetical protein